VTTKIAYTLYVPGQDPVQGSAEFDGINLTTIRAAVDPFLNGGRLEHVSVLHQGKAKDMFVDEDFVAKDLPRNEEATKIYRNNSMKRNPGQDPEGLPPIQGPAILFHERVWF
jgi:hypothetical protein